MSQLAVLHSQLERLRTLARMNDDELRATSPISAWSPAQHLDHMVKVSSALTGLILNFETPRLARGITITGRAVLALGWIPRGRGKAPERLHGTHVTRDELLASLDALAAKVQRVDATHLVASRGPIAPHPIFGGLTPRQALRFITVHNNHHMRIVRDVLRARR